ncbi:hypothetical protein GDO86_011662 [Hymenochirus boettgeri]|uniref:Shugoshin C-terminal domain-containing protein n=1 Tax=Hymenochirus boettgeri TaxID=247094 RepID=A0A8T2JHY3_9PIPI|nr:hypothetical protein GDO86_011662 [Hymenochirus boettgeri]
MVKERCLRQAFQDSLEDIKERMKEKRIKKLAKANTVNKTLCTKVQILNNSSVAVKNYKANNKALALALEAEKLKTRQAQDLILHLKREHQRMMFEIFMLRRKLQLQQGRDTAESKLASMKDIIAKVAHNLLETANLLEPAHALCSNEIDSRLNPSVVDKKESNNPGVSNIVHRLQDSGSSTVGNVIPEALKRNLHKVILEPNERATGFNQISRGRISQPHQSSFTSKMEESNLIDGNESGSRINKNVSLRRRASSLNIFLEESLPLEDNVNSHHNVPEPENNLLKEECTSEIRREGRADNSNAQSPVKEMYNPLGMVSRIKSSTPEPKPRRISNKNKEETHAGRERVRKGKADKVVAQLKKPWENSKPRARSKSKERSATKQSKEKMNSSLNSGDAYDFAFEETVHITPFRQNKSEESQNELEESLKGNRSEYSISGEELDDSLYLPYKERGKNRNSKPNISPITSRPRSKRNKTEVSTELVSEKIMTRNSLKRKSENTFTEAVETYTEKSSFPTCMKTNENILECLEVKVISEELDNDTIPTAGEPGGSSTPRIRFSDVTNLSENTDSKKHLNVIFNEDERMTFGTPARKRRCKVAVNYAEPKISGKLRRGDPFTDTEFLNSPIFKQKDSKRNSLNRQSLSRYNEVFVGCSR